MRAFRTIGHIALWCAAVSLLLVSTAVSGYTSAAGQQTDAGIAGRRATARALPLGSWDFPYLMDASANGNVRTPDFESVGVLELCWQFQFEPADMAASQRSGNVNVINAETGRSVHLGGSRARTACQVIDPGPGRYFIEVSSRSSWRVTARETSEAAGDIRLPESWPQTTPTSVELGASDDAESETFLTRGGPLEICWQVDPRRDAHLTIRAEGRDAPAAFSLALQGAGCKDWGSPAPGLWYVKVGSDTGPWRVTVRPIE